jgi:hypothetical protein
MTIRSSRAVVLLSVLVAVASFLSCGGGSSQTTSVATAQSGTVFVTGSDAPIPSVLAFQVTITSVTLSDGNNTVSVLSGPTTIEFSRLLGLRTLLALGSLPAGNYTSATITLQDPVISFLDLSTTPASVSTIPNATLTQSSLTVPLNPGLPVNANGLAGLHLDFRLRESLELDGSGQITGVVNPVIRIRAVRPEEDDGHIDELRGGLSSVDVAGNSFVMQRPNGRQITIRVTNATQFAGTSGLASMAPPAIVEVSGIVQADGSIRALEVEVMTTDRALLAGLVLNVDPTSGPANNLTLLVREELPDLSSIQVGRSASVSIGDSTHFGIRNFDLPIESELFGRSEIVLGQRVAVGGEPDTSATPETLEARRVVLHRQGLDGSMVPGSVTIESGNRGHFQLLNDGFWGYLFGGPLRVTSRANTRFVNLDGLSAVGPDMRLRVVGLLLRDNSGNPVLVAGRIERLLPMGP